MSTSATTAVLERLFGPWVRWTTRQTLRADLMAGLLGAVLVLPQGIAFATLAGMPPEYGLYTAIIPCIIAALFGSSWHVMSGPTNANSLALLAMLSPLAVPFGPAYVQLALAVTVLVGLMQWLIGALRLGMLADFISPSVLFGFTSGAAVLIMVHALPSLLGLSVSGSAWGVLSGLWSQAGQWQPAALAVALLTVGVTQAVRRWRPRWPAMLLGLVVATALAWLASLQTQLAPWVADLAEVGTVPVPWPHFQVPQINWALLPELMGLALSLTIVALGQAISMAKAVAARSGQRIDANREFRGQGLSNLVGGFFSCYVSCGSVNRSMPNLEAGARTPMASVFSALLLLLLTALIAPLLARIPMAAVAALLLLVGWALLDFGRWRELLRLSRQEFFVAATTLVATLTIRLEMAILLGTLLSLLAFLLRTARPAMRTMGFDSTAPERQFVVLEGEGPGREQPSPPKPQLPECPQLKLLRMEGEVYFGACTHVSDTLQALRSAPQPQKHLLVMGKSMNFIDLAGAKLWEAELTARRAMGGDLYFHRPRPEVLRMWQTTGFTRLLGPEHQFPDKRTAIATIFDKLDPEVCRTCQARVFWECQRLPPPSPPSQ
jgi:SulP family sulfate permease